MAVSEDRVAARSAGNERQSRPRDGRTDGPSDADGAEEIETFTSFLEAEYIAQGCR